MADRLPGKVSQIGDQRTAEGISIAMMGGAAVEIGQQELQQVARGVGVAQHRFQA